jgi:hypothetical protein
MFSTSLPTPQSYPKSRRGNPIRSIRPIIIIKLILAELADLSAASEKDVDIAVLAAQKAYDTVWGLKVPGTERGKLLLKLADLVEKHGDELAALEALNNGKAVKIARNVDVKSAADVLRCAFYLSLSRGAFRRLLTALIDCGRRLCAYRYYGGWADKIHGKTIEVNESKLAYTRVEPCVHILTLAGDAFLFIHALCRHTFHNTLVALRPI